MFRLDEMTTIIGLKRQRCRIITLSGLMDEIEAALERRTGLDQSFLSDLLLISLLRLAYIQSLVALRTRQR